MNRYSDKRVLLTGGASGIGRATALRVLAEGATLHAVDRSEEGLAELTRLAAEASQTAAEDGSQPHGILTTSVLDVTDEAAIVATVAEVAGRLDGIDVLFNIAGMHVTTPMETITADQLRQAFEVNLVGTVLMCREVMPHLRKRGAIVNTASTAATKAHPYMAAYAASKGAVLAFTISLAAELAPRKIRVVAVSPGGVDTALTQAVAQEKIDFSFFSRVMPLLPFGKPEQLAGMMAFAGSDDASYITAVDLRADGGSYA